MKYFNFRFLQRHFLDLLIKKQFIFIILFNTFKNKNFRNKKYYWKIKIKNENKKNKNKKI